MMLVMDSIPPPLPPRSSETRQFNDNGLRVGKFSPGHLPKIILLCVVGIVLLLASVAAARIFFRPADTTPPSAPLNLLAVPSGTSGASLHWKSPADTKDVAMYKVYRDSVEIAGLVTRTAYDDTGLQPGKSYYYTVKAVDQAGNVSVASNKAVVTLASVAVSQDDAAPKPSVPTPVATPAPAPTPSPVAITPRKTTKSTTPSTPTPGPIPTPVSTPPPSPPVFSLPAGVVLRDVDGGPDYFAQWDSSFPTDPSFFPLAIFNGFDLGGGRAANHKAAGINTYVGLYNGVLAGVPPELDVIAGLGMYAVGEYEPQLASEPLTSLYSDVLTGYVYQDEGEGRDICPDQVGDPWELSCVASGGKTETSSFVAMSNILRGLDTTRPVYQGWTNGYVFDWFLNGVLQDLVDSSDIIGYDVYAKVDTRSDFDGALSLGRVWGHHDTVTLARSNAGYAKPIWPDIEISAVDTDSGMNPTDYQPTPADIKAMVWQAIVAGARGITYFNNCFCTNIKSSQDVLNDSFYATNRAAIASVNAEVTALAPVINAPYADNYINSIMGTVNVMAKYYVTNSSFYVFAAAKSTGAQSVTFNLKAGSTVTVENENRTLPITNGSFTDTFSGETAYHIYKVTP